VKDGSSRRRARRIAIGAAVVLALAGMNGPALYRFGTDQYHEYKINKPEYKADNGSKLPHQMVRGAGDQVHER